MPYVLLFIGAVLIISGIRNTQGQLGKLLISDFTGSGNFIYWIVSIIVVGSIGYIDGFEKFSRAFMVLIVLALLLSNKGFFTQFVSALKSGTAQPAPATNESVGYSSGGSGSSGSGSSNLLPAAASAISVIGF